MDPAEDSRPATLAIVLSALGVVFVAVFSIIPNSPFRPVSPSGYGAGGPLAWLSRLSLIERLHGDQLLYAGMLIKSFAVVTFLLLLREAWRGNVSLRTVLLLAIIYHVVVLWLPLLFSRDVYSYAIYGRIVSIYHANPYVQTPVYFSSDSLWPLLGPKWVDTASVYGPLFNTLSGWLARVTSSTQEVVEAYRAVAVAASLATVAVVAWTAKRLWPSRSAFAVVAVGINPVILFDSVGGGHNDILLALAVAVAFAFMVRGHELPAVMTLTLGAAIKAAGVLPLLLLLIWCVGRRPSGQRLRALVTHGGLAVGAYLAMSAPYLQLHDPSLGMLKLATHEGWLAPSLFLHQLVNAVSFDQLGWIVRIGFPLILAVCVFLLGREVGRRAPTLPILGLGASWGWLLVLFMLLAPVLLPWYVVWAMPLVWLLPTAPRWALLGAGIGLSLTEWVAEANLYPRQFSVESWIGHWLALPTILAALVWGLIDLHKRIEMRQPLQDVPSARRFQSQDAGGNVASVGRA